MGIPLGVPCALPFDGEGVCDASVGSKQHRTADSMLCVADSMASLVCRDEVSHSRDPQALRVGERR